MLISGLVSAFGIYLLCFKKIVFLNINSEEIATALIMSLCIHVSIFIVFPVTVERSQTVYLLNVIKKNEHISADALESEFIKNYIKKNNAIGKRLDEQSVTGTVMVSNRQLISLTKKGNLLLPFFDLVKRAYGIY